MTTKRTALKKASNDGWGRGACGEDIMEYIHTRRVMSSVKLDNVADSACFKCEIPRNPSTRAE